MREGEKEDKMGSGGGEREGRGRLEIGGGGSSIRRGAKDGRRNKGYYEK